MTLRTTSWARKDLIAARVAMANLLRAPAAVEERGSASAAGILPGHPPARALAHRHDEGVDHTARLVYLHAIVDCCTCELVGWSLDLLCRDGEAIAPIEVATTWQDLDVLHIPAT